MERTIVKNEACYTWKYICCHQSCVRLVFGHVAIFCNIKGIVIEKMMPVWCSNFLVHHLFFKTSFGVSTKYTVGEKHNAGVASKHHPIREKGADKKKEVPD